MIASKPVHVTAYAPDRPVDVAYDVSCRFGLMDVFCIEAPFETSVIVRVAYSEVHVAHFCCQLYVSSCHREQSAASFVRSSCDLSANRCFPYLFLGS